MIERIEGVLSMVLKVELDLFGLLSICALLFFSPLVCTLLLPSSLKDPN